MSKADELLKKATSYEMLALYSDRKSFLKSLAQMDTPEAAKQWGNLDEFGNPIQSGIPKPGEDPGVTMNMPADTITAFRSNPKLQQVQKAINKIPGISMPLEEDGKLGPNTRAAIKSFRGSYNLPSSMSDAEVCNRILNVAKGMAQNEKSPLDPHPGSTGNELRLKPALPFGK